MVYITEEPPTAETRDEEGEIIIDMSPTVRVFARTHHSAVVEEVTSTHLYLTESVQEISELMHCVYCRCVDDRLGRGSNPCLLAI